MIMPRGAHQLLLPVNPLFIGLSLLAALAFNLLPLGRHPALPDVLALTLAFWAVHQPRRVGLGTAFVCGLLMDVHQGIVHNTGRNNFPVVNVSASPSHAPPSCGPRCCWPMSLPVIWTARPAKK